MRGLAALRQEPFIKAATGWFLWGRPFQIQLLHSVRQVAEKNSVHTWAGWAGLRRMQGAGSWYEPNSSSASEAVNDRLLSILPSLFPPNETRSLEAAEGYWSGQMKRTGENSLFCSYRGILWRESRRIAAGNPWTSCCRHSGLLRSGESAEQSEVWIHCDGSHIGEGFESRRAKVL